MQNQFNLDNSITTTDRELEREFEDSQYVPVIVKRTDETIKHPDDILHKAIEEGLEQHSRENTSLWLSSIAAGLILGFAGMCVALMTQLFLATESELLTRLGTALVYPLGFIICILSGTQLFTEHTATAIYPVLDKKVGLKSLAKLWSIVLLGNLLGAFISSILIYQADSVIMAKDGFIKIADHLIHFGFMDIFFSALLAGWLMAQGGWLILSTTASSVQVISIYAVTFIIGLGGLHHSIAGSVEVFSYLLHSSNPEYLKSFFFVMSAIFGNLVGGSLFVGILNYAQIKHTRSL